MAQIGRLRKSLDETEPCTAFVVQTLRGLDLWWLTAELMRPVQRDQYTKEGQDFS